jgi:AraC-like DNA-binding protein
VNRDELKDGGASIFAATIEAIRSRCPGTTIEVLIPDFKGSRESLETVLAAGPDILNHNVETVPRLYKRVRPGANYAQSVELLRRVKEIAPGTVSKTGMMLGLGESPAEVGGAMQELASDAGVDVLTLGQYLQPTPEHLPVARFVHPDEFQARSARDGAWVSPCGGRPLGSKLVSRGEPGTDVSDEYREHQPSDALKPFIDCYWTRVGREGAETRVIPDGAVDIILDLAAPSLSSAAFVVGTMTAPLVVSTSRPCEYVAVRFHPGGAQPLLGNSMRELSDHRVALASIWSSQVASEWTERLKEVESGPGRVRLLERLLIGRIPGSPPPDPRVREAVRRIKLSGGSFPVKRMSSTLGLTRQHLTRLFDFHVGVGVKIFSRITRLRHVLRALERASPERCRVDWARLAVDAGYFDQAHLVRDFKALTGLTPERFQHRD